MYDVKLNRPIPNYEIQSVLNKLRDGVVITTETVRNGRRKKLTASTHPCRVTQINKNRILSNNHNSCRWLRIVLEEGRNRQIRKMIKAVGYHVVELHRLSFAGITLEGLENGPGDWNYLSEEENKIIENMIRIAAHSTSSSRTLS